MGQWPKRRWTCEATCSLVIAYRTYVLVRDVRLSAEDVRGKQHVRRVFLVL